MTMAVKVLLGVVVFFLVGITLASGIRSVLDVSGMSATVIAASCELTVLIVAAAWADAWQRREK